MCPGSHVLLDHTPFARTQHAYTCIGRTTYDTYLYINQKNSAVQLTSVGLAPARPNYFLAYVVLYILNAVI